MSLVHNLPASVTAASPDWNLHMHVFHQGGLCKMKSKIHIVVQNPPVIWHPFLSPISPLLSVMTPLFQQNSTQDFLLCSMPIWGPYVQNTACCSLLSYLLQLLKQNLDIKEDQGQLPAGSHSWHQAYVLAFPSNRHNISSFFHSMTWPFLKNAQPHKRN